MKILDTHAWIWWTSDPNRLSKKARQEIERSKQRGIAAISCWEFATLLAKRRISVDRGPMEWIEQSLSSEEIELLPLTPAIAVRAVQLGNGFHGDPADRLIVATALTHDASLITQDERIRAYEPVRALW